MLDPSTRPDSPEASVRVVGDPPAKPDSEQKGSAFGMGVGVAEGQRVPVSSAQTYEAIDHSPGILVDRNVTEALADIQPEQLEEMRRELFHSQFGQKSEAEIEACINERLQQNIQAALDQQKEKFRSRQFPKVDPSTEFEGFSGAFTSREKQNIQWCGFIYKGEDTRCAGEFSIPAGDQGGEVPVVFSGVFDGHIGKEASQLVSEQLGSYLKYWLEQSCREKIGAPEVYFALTKTFRRLKDDLKVEVEKLKPGDQPEELQNGRGTTASLMVKIKDDIYFANAGDSRALVITKPSGSVLQVTEDARCSLGKYQTMVAERGGFLAPRSARTPGNFVNCELANPTSIGHYFLRTNHYSHQRQFGEVVSPDPVITWVDAKEVSAIIQATDGLWGIASSDEVGAWFKAIPTEDLDQTTLHTLVGKAHAVWKQISSRGRMDDITVQVTLMDRPTQESV